MMCTEFINSYLWSEALNLPFAQDAQWQYFSTILLDRAYSVQVSIRQQRYQVLQAAPKFRILCSLTTLNVFPILAPKNFTSLLVSLPPTLFFFQWITYLGVLYEENPSTSGQGQISTERQNDQLLQWKQPTGDHVTTWHLSHEQNDQGIF